MRKILYRMCKCFDKTIYKIRVAQWTVFQTWFQVEESGASRINPGRSSLRRFIVYVTRYVVATKYLPDFRYDTVNGCHKYNTNDGHVSQLLFLC
jgi:hypothetical protein